MLPTTKKQDSLLYSYSTHAAFVPIGLFDESGKKALMSGHPLVRTIYHKRNDSDVEELVHSDSHPKPSSGSLYWCVLQFCSVLILYIILYHHNR